ncbi:MAG: cation diffusion facilitator family transporter [Aromatoleum sp.]|nr:cation diffusion facilitator family transporter [Aromatoleum sp.]
MSHGGSKKVVILALLANGGIAAAKFAAAFLTGSGAMMAEAIHSSADCGNQTLLLVGAARAKKAPTDAHPLGYGREAYFWGMLVAVLLFSLGGVFSVYEGIHKLIDPHELDHVQWAVGVLLFSFVLEAMSFRAAWSAVRDAKKDRPFLEWARTTGDVDLLVVTFEDLAALVGLALALTSVVLALVTHHTAFDAAGSIGVGLVLLAVALFVGAQIRRLIVGFSVDEEMRAQIRRIWKDRGFDVFRLIAVWTGPHKVMLAIKVKLPDDERDARRLVDRLNDAEAAVRAALPEIAFSFVEPDVAD